MFPEIIMFPNVYVHPLIHLVGEFFLLTGPFLLAHLCFESVSSGLYNLFLNFQRGPVAHSIPPKTEQMTEIQ